MDAENNTKNKSLTTTITLQTTDLKYVKLVSLISDVWKKARGNEVILYATPKIQTVSGQF